MNESMKALFLRPLFIQESIILFVLAPILLCFFPYCSPDVMKYPIPVFALGALAANVGLFAGSFTKYILIRPALRIMGRESYTADEMHQAVRSLAVLPAAESIVTFLRFSLSGNLIGPFTLYQLGYISYGEAVNSAYIVVLMGVITIPLIYLTSENSLSTFYTSTSLTEDIVQDEGIFFLKLGTKSLCSIVFIVSPPLGFIFVGLHIAQLNNIPLLTLQKGIYVLLCQSVSLAFMSGVINMKNIKLSVERMSFMFHDMAKGQGDLTKRLTVTGLNEIGKLAFWFNTFIKDIEKIMEHVRVTCLELHHTAEEVNENSQDLSNETQHQATTMQEMSDAINDMNMAIQKTAELVIQGIDTSNAMIGLIDQNKQVFAELMNAIQEISLDSRKIGDIVSTVNEVAFHTNLLALNASVEAARAGEHGKGFAVVAGEVRSLAQRSSNAASEIKGLIEGTVGRIKNGDEMMRKTSTSLEELMGRMEFFFRMMEAIDKSSSDQTKNIAELTRAVSMIDYSAQHSAKTAQSLADTLMTLREMAVTLTRDVKKFKTSFQ
jgi:methyl-accepting chemotaxis protein